MSEDNHEGPAAEVHKLLYELCVDLGFCLHPEDQRALRDDPPHDPNAFTDAVFVAEGMHPARHPDLRRQVRSRVEQHMRDWTATEPGDQASH